MALTRAAGGHLFSQSAGLAPLGLLPYAWLHRSRAYAFLSASVAISLTLLALMTRDPMPTIVPIVTAACYALAVGWMWIENRER